MPADAPAPAVATRLARVDDADAIARIYNQGIADRIATFETEPRDAAAVRSWFETPRGTGARPDLPYPVVVALRGGEVVAFAATSRYRPRACYADIAEFSVYVERGERGRGHGARVMRALLAEARVAGLRKLVSRVFTDNLASRRLLARVGFREVGVYLRHGRLDGAWRDVVIVECLLDEPGDGEAP